MLFPYRACAFVLLPWLAACSGASSNKDPVFDAKFQNEKRIGEEDVTKRQIRDAEFVVETASRKMELLEISQIAQRKGTSADVRYTSQNVVNQVTDLFNKTKALAQQNNLVLPNALGESQAKQVGEMTALNGAAFDKQFSELLTRIIEQDIDNTEKMTKDAYNGDIRMLAAGQLTVLKDLKLAAESLHEKLNP